MMFGGATTAMGHSVDVIKPASDKMMAMVTGQPIDLDK